MLIHLIKIKCYLIFYFILHFVYIKMQCVHMSAHTCSVGRGYTSEKVDQFIMLIKAVARTKLIVTFFFVLANFNNKICIFSAS